MYTSYNSQPHSHPGWWRLHTAHTKTTQHTDNRSVHTIYHTYLCLFLYRGLQRGCKHCLWYLLINQSIHLINYIRTKGLSRSTVMTVVGLHCSRLNIVHENCADHEITRRCSINYLGSTDRKYRHNKPSGRKVGAYQVKACHVNDE